MLCYSFVNNFFYFIKFKIFFNHLFYFERELYQHVRKMDASRPITFVNSQQIQNAKAVKIIFEIPYDNTIIDNYVFL